MKYISNNAISNDTIELIKKHLKLQKMYELPEDGTDVSHLYHLTDTDYELGGYALGQMLKNSGYKEISSDEFNNKIKLFFENAPNCILSYTKKHNNFYTLFVNIGKEKDIAKTEDDYTYDHIFVFPKYKAISVLPLLNGSVTLENNNLSFSHDQNAISRNKYLFNDSKADFIWLLANDQEFLKNLLIVFGYDKEEKINEQVLNDLFKAYEARVPISTEKIGEIFFVKDCNGKLKIREGLLKYVSNHTTKDDDRFIYALGNYLNNLFKEDVDHIFDEDLRKNFTIDEKAKIVAYVTNIESPAFYKYKGSESTAWHNAGTILYNITAAHPEILKIIEENNYYGLKALKAAAESDEFINEKTNSVPSDKDFSENREIKDDNKFYLYDRADFSSFSREIIAKGEIEYLNKTADWNYIKVNDTVGYIPTEEQKEKLVTTEKRKHSFLADDEAEIKEKKGFWDSLFG